MRYFNTEGVCSPDQHYMVRLDERLDKIKRLYVDRGKYFVINRGRQYGKTTTLYALEKYLKLAEYLDYYHLKKGYMLSFNFNKKKEIGVKEVAIGDKVIMEAVV